MHLSGKKLLTLIAAFFLAWLGLRCLLPLFSPFLFGTALALAAEPVVRRLCGSMGLPRSVSAGIGVSFTFLLLCTLLLLLCAFLIREIGTLAGFLPDMTVAFQSGIALLQGKLFRLSQHAPESIRPLLQENVNSLFSSGSTLVDQILRSILGFTGNLLSHIPNSALALATTILSAFMISAKLPRLRRALLRRMPQERRQALFRAWSRLKASISGWFAAQVKLMGITFLILLAGFFLLRISHPVLYAAGIALVDAFPVLGTGTILIPWALFLLLNGQRAQAIGLAGVYVTVSLLRSMLEPKLVGRHLGLDPLITLAALYAGFQLWGIGGMLLAPLLTVTAIQLFPEQQR